MMPTYLYKCDQCPCESIEIEFIALHEGITTDNLDCNEYNRCTHLDCTGLLKRVYTTPMIGTVKGAGGSPPR